jgi:hypothetical protein
VLAGAVGGALGALVIVLIGIILWQRKKGARTPPSAGQQQFFGQQPSSQPSTPTSPTNSNYTGGPPVTYAAQAGWHPQQPTPFTLPAGARHSVASLTGPPSWQSAPSTYGKPTTIHQGNYGGYASQSHVSHPAEGSVGTKGSHSDALQGSSYSAMPPMSASSPAPAYDAPAYPFTPPANGKT